MYPRETVVDERPAWPGWRICLVNRIDSAYDSSPDLMGVGNSYGEMFQRC